MVFPVVMYGCEIWTVKKAERRRIDAFELWCWRRLLRVPWTARRSNQSNVKEISPEYSLEGLKLKLQYFGHLMQRTDSLEKTLTLGKIVGDGQGSLACCSLLLGLQRVGHDWATELKDYSKRSSNLWHVMMASSIIQFHTSSPSFLASLFFLFLILQRPYFGLALILFWFCP